MRRAPSASVKTSAVSAEMSDVSQQQPSSAGRSSAKTAEGPGPSQQQQDSAGSVRFTPAQQEVAAGLMEVVKRPMQDGPQAVQAAKKTLISNNTATKPFLSALPAAAPLPTCKHVERGASAELLRSLSKLARQCAANRCQPLEVFSRSVQCTAHAKCPSCTAVLCRTGHRGAFDWGQRQIPEGPPLLTPAMAQELARDLQQLGMQQSMGDLHSILWQVLAEYVIDQDAKELMTQDLGHVFPGGCLRSSQCMRQWHTAFSRCHSGHPGSVHTCLYHSGVLSSIRP